MADGVEDIGGVAISIDGDYSALAAAFSSSETLAAQAGEAIAEAFTEGVSGAEEMTAAVQQVGDASRTAGEQMVVFGDDVGSVPFADASDQLNLFTDGLEPFTEEMEQAAAATDTAAESVGKFGEAEEQTAPATHEAAGGAGELLETMLEFAGITVGIEALAEFAGEALATYASVQQATIALTALTGSATQAGEEIEGLKELALSDALSFPQLLAADQKMTALGISAAAIAPALQAAGDAAKATGNSFDTMTNVIDRLALTGTLSGRALANLGLSVQDFASVMGVSADQVKDKFAEMDPTERVQTITDALTKFAGVAHDTAGTISGEWQNLKTESEFAFEAVGNALAPVASALMHLAGTVITDLGDAYKSMIDTITTFTSAVSAALQPLAQLISSLEAVKDAAGPVGSLLSTLWNIVKDYNAFALAADAIRGVASAITYLSGTIPDANVMTQAMTDKLAQLQKSGTDATATLKQVADMATASIAAHRDAGNAISVYSDALSDAQSKYDKVVASYSAGKAAASELISAQNALTSAQESYNDQLGAMPDMAKPTRLFQAALVDLASQEDIAAAAADAQKVKLDGLLLNLGLANQNLAEQDQRYKDAVKSGGDLILIGQDLTRALADQQSAQKALNEMTAEYTKLAKDPPSLAPMFDLTTKSIQQGVDALRQMLPAVEAPAKPVATLSEDFAAMKLTVDDVSNTVSTKLLNAFDDLSNHGEITLQQVQAAWGKVSGAVNKLAQTDMPAALVEYQRYIDLLTQSGAAEYQVQQAIAAKLNAEIKYAEQSGTDATAAIVQLTNIQLAQAAAKDQATAFGTAYSDVLKDISTGFQTIGKDIADNIVDGKNWSDVWHGFLKDLEKEILEQLIGIAFKTLGDTIASTVSGLLGLGSTAATAATTTATAASDAAKTISDTASTASSAVGSTASAASSAVSSVGSSVIGTIGAIGSAVGALATIFTIFQNAQQETSLNAIEHNTRYEEIIIEQSQQSIWWPMKVNSDYMVGSLNDISRDLAGMAAVEGVWIPFLGDISTHLLLLGDIESETGAMAQATAQYLPYLKTISESLSTFENSMATTSQTTAASHEGATSGRRSATAAAAGLEPGDFSPVGVPAASAPAAAGGGGITLQVDMSNSTYGNAMTPQALSDAVLNAATRLLRASGARY